MEKGKSNLVGANASSEISESLLLVVAIAQEASSSASSMTKVSTLLPAVVRLLGSSSLRAKLLADGEEEEFPEVPLVKRQPSEGGTKRLVAEDSKDVTRLSDGGKRALVTRRLEGAFGPSIMSQTTIRPKVTLILTSNTCSIE